VEKTSASLNALSGDEKVIALAVDLAKAAIDKVEKSDVKAVYNVVKDASIAAVGATTLVVSNYVDAEALADKIITTLNQKLDITLSRQYVDDLAKEIYDYFKGKAPAIRDDAEAVKDILAANRERATAVAYIAAGMAKEMYSDLKKCDDYTPLTDIVLNTTVKVKFSGFYGENETRPTDYEADTRCYSYDYPVTFEMQLDNRDSNTTIFDNIEYKYQNGHFVNVKITENAKQAYKQLIQGALDRVQASETVNKAINKFYNEFIAKSGMSAEDLVDDFAGEDSTINQTLVKGLVSLDMDATDAQDLVSGHLNAWADSNVTDNIAESPMIDLIVTGSSTGNQSMYDLVEAIADQAIEKADYSKGFLGKVYYDSTFDEFCEDFPKSLGFVGLFDATEAAGLSGVNNYILARIFDYVRTDSHGEIISDPNLEEPAAFTDEITAGMKKAIDNKIVSAVKETITSSGKVTAEQLDTLKQLEKLRVLTDIDSFKDIELSSLAPALKNKKVQDLIAKYEDNVVSRYTALLRYIPDEASLILPNGTEISEKTLKDVRDAENFGDACKAVAALLSQFGDLSLSDFGTEQKITVKYDGQTHNIQASFGLMIEIDE